MSETDIREVVRERYAQAAQNVRARALRAAGRKNGIR